MNSSANNLNRLGIAHAQKREFQQAAGYFRQAIAADPSTAGSYANLGYVLTQLGHFQSAKAPYQRALTLEPRSPDLHVRYGDIHVRLNDYAGAAVAFQKAVELAPNTPAFHSRLGIALVQLRRYAEAISAFRRSIHLVPQEATDHVNLAMALCEIGDYDAGFRSFEEAVRLKPDFPDIHRNFASALVRAGRLLESLPHFRSALNLKPDDPGARCRYAAALAAAGNLAESLAHYDAALKLEPDNQVATVGRAVVLLLSGDYHNGWPAYDRRLKYRSIVFYTHNEPMWDGSPLNGRALLIEAEQQGLGDTIQFVRYAQEIKRFHAAHVIVVVQPALVPLLTGIAGADVLIAQNEPRPRFDVWAPLLSLPRIMGHDPTCFPASIPYLKADPARVEKWNARLTHVQGLKVGIAWQGSRINIGDASRSFPVSAFASIAILPGVTLISLQKGDGTEQLNGASGFCVSTIGGNVGNVNSTAGETPAPRIFTLGDDFDASGGAFMDTAAVMMNLDLIITADTAVAHLAGALGRPVWLALALSPDWRWGMTGSTTPWYPTMRLFRQPKPGDWGSVFQAMAEELGRR